MYVLPRAAIPLTDENLSSLITRNGRAYGFDNPTLVLDRIGSNNRQPGILAFTEPDPRLASLLGVEMPTLHGLSSWHAVGGMARVGGREIRRRFLHVNLRRSCPACLRESLHHRAIWDVIAISYCARHGCRLIAACPGCRKPPVWRGCRLESCGHDDCRFDLREAPLENDGTVPAHVAALSGLYASGTDATVLGFGFDFGTAVETTFTLGSYATRSGLLGKASTFLRSHPERVADVMEAGWTVLADWPGAFDVMLDGIRDGARQRAGRYGLHREFGGFAKWLSVHVDAAWAVPFRNAFADYLVRQPDLATSVAALRRFGSPERLRNRHMTLRDAATFLEVAPETMAELAERESLFLVRPSGMGAPSALRADLVHALGRRKTATMLRNEAAAALGVGVGTLRKMLEAGILRTVGADTRVTHFRAILRSDVEDVVRRARDGVEETVARGKLVPIAFTMAGRRDMLEVLRAVLDGRLRARAIRPDRPGLRGLLFDSLEVGDILTPKAKTLTLVAAAERLDLNTECARAWAREGLLQTVRSDSPHERGYRVTEECLQTFAATYVTSLEIGRMASTTGRWAFERLRFLGHPPIPSTSVTKLYRRSEITPDLIGRLRPRSSPGRARSVAEASGIVDRVGRDVASRLGRQLRRAWSGFSDASGGTYVQVVVGRRQRYRSNYVFRFNPQMRKRLTAARDGWLALALAGYDTYVVISWAEALRMVGSATDHRHHIRIAVDADGHVVGDVVLESMQRWITEAAVRPP